MSRAGIDIQPIISRLASTRQSVAALDVAECLDGYWDGRRADPAPGPNRSASYVQGWWAGMGDGHHRDTHPIDREIASAVLANLRAAKS